MADPKTPAYLEGLNDAQYEAAVHLDGPCLVVAGAGAGKTLTITARVQCLIKWYGVDPNDILCITFTRKAAAEMRERIQSSLDEDSVTAVQVRTFHSTGVQICRHFSHLMGLKERISIWDERAALRQMKIAARDVVNFAEEGRVEPNKKRAYTPTILLNFLSGWKEDGHALDESFWNRFSGDDIADQFRSSHKRANQDIEDLYERVGKAKIKGNLTGSQDVRFHQHLKEMTKIIRQYEGTKSEIGAVDLTDLIWLPVIRAQDTPEFREILAKRWQYVIVDEYQDTNDLQEAFVSNLVANHQNLMVVGDDDQAIYGWRGSNVALITSFEQRWNAKVIQLGQNYRSRPTIVNYAASIIRNNAERVPKRLWSMREPGGSIIEEGFIYQQDEIEAVARKIASSILLGTNPSTIAVLARRRTWVSAIYNELIKLEIPVEGVGIKPWYTRDDVHILLSFLRSIVNRRDIDAAQQVLAAWPGIGAKTIKLWYRNLQFGSEVFTSPLSALLRIPRHGPHTKKGRSIVLLQETVNKTHKLIADGAPLSDIIELVMDASGMSSSISKQKEGNQKDHIQAQYRMQGIGNLLDHVGKYRTTTYTNISLLGDDISTLISLQESMDDRVTVSTIHSAKGLEWDTVYLLGCSTGIIPTGPNIQEERRLFYVAMTRAKENFYPTYSLTVRGFDGRYVDTSRTFFLSEADLTYTENDEEVFCPDGDFATSGVTIEYPDAGWPF